MRSRLCPKEALFTPSFIAVCSANLLFFIASFMMVPVLPIYLLDGLHASKSVVGIILSAYMIGALVMRPISGFLADQFPRKMLFLACGILFAAQFEGYLLFKALALVGIVRALHGMSFGALSTSAATLAVDVIPIAKLGTGIGLYGMMGSLAMALGPMIGMLVLEAGSYDAVFITAMGCAAGGVLLGLLVRKQRVTLSRGEKISLDRFFLKKAPTPSSGWCSWPSCMGCSSTTCPSSPANATSWRTPATSSCSCPLGSSSAAFLRAA